MEINKTCKLILNNIYLYDIISCHYRILEKNGFDLSGIDKENKEQRNIKIGLMMRDNQEITNLLRNTTKEIVDRFIQINNIKEEQIILRQYDGLLLTKLCKNILSDISPEFRKDFDKFIISITRNQYIALFESSKIEVKGVSHKYPYIESLYKKLLMSNFLSKDCTFQTMQDIKKEILTNENPSDFCINIDSEKYIMFIKKYGQIEITENMAEIMDPTDIDREKYFTIYMIPFFKSIVKESI